MRLFTALLFLLLSTIAYSEEKVLVSIQTNFGTIEAELFPEKAPLSVENFLNYVDKGQYNGTIFHRVISSFMIQGGGFDKDFKKVPTDEPVRNEAANGLENKRGTLAMARTMAPHSATSQFFINVINNRSLNYKSAANGRTWGYAVFGEVTKGMDVVDKIRYLETGAKGPFPRDVPLETAIIEKIERIKP